MSEPLGYVSANIVISDTLSSATGDAGAKALIAKYEHASEVDRAVLFMVAIYRLAGTEQLLNRRRAA